MNEIANNFELAVDQFIPEMLFRQPGFTYSAGGPFSKNKQRIQKFKETGDLRYIYQNELDQACFRHDMVYGDFKDINRRIFADKVLYNKAFNIAEDPNTMDINVDFLQWFINSLIKERLVKVLKNENISNKKSGKQLHKPIIRTFNKRKEHSPFIDNIWGADLAEMQLTSKFNKGFRILLFVIDIYSKYPWVISLKNKESIAITNAFRKILKESNRKSNKIWVDKGSDFIIVQ